MVTSSLGDLNTPTRPSIYNENDDIVKKQLRDNSKEHTESNYQRSRSLSSCPVILDKSKKKLQVEPTYAASFPNISSKPILEEVIIEKRAQNNDDNEKSNERNHQKEEPYVFEGGRNYAYNDYTSPYYDRYTRRRIGQRYSSLQHKSPIRHDSLVGNIPKHDEPRSGWSSLSHAFREPLAEFFGVFILVLFGDGSIAQVILSNNTRGDWQSICWGWGLGMMLGVYASRSSGSHINPAVTFTNCLLRKQPWFKFPIYATAQIFGAFCAAGVVYGNYKSAIDVFEGRNGVRTVPGFSNTATAGIFATYPQDFVSRTTEFFNEFIAAAILMFCIFMLQDQKSSNDRENIFPISLFFVVFGIGACFGWQTGFAINMARDFGPRLFTSCIGYGINVWTAGNHYFWIPIIAPFVGCLFGGVLYDFFLNTGNSSLNKSWFSLKGLVRAKSKGENRLL